MTSDIAQVMKGESGIARFMKGGNRRPRDPNHPARGIPDQDLGIMIHRQWLPKTDVPELEEMRQRLEGLIDVREAKQNEATKPRQKFADEDKAKQEALDYRYLALPGQEPRPTPVITPPEERKSLLEEADAHASAAAHAVVAYAVQVLNRLRGGPEFPPPDAPESARPGEPTPLPPEPWNPTLRAQALEVPPGGLGAELMAHIATEENALREQIYEAQQVIAKAQGRLGELHPLKVWMARNTNGGTGAHGLMFPANGQNMRAPGALMQTPDGSFLPAPVTGGAKPRDMNVPGWGWNDEQAQAEEAARAEAEVLPDEPWLAAEHGASGESRGLTPEEAAEFERRASGKDDPDETEAADTLYLSYLEMGKEELEAEAQERGLTVERGRESNGGQLAGGPRKEDFARALASAERTQEGE